MHLKTFCGDISTYPYSLSLHHAVVSISVYSSQLDKQNTGDRTGNDFFVDPKWCQRRIESCHYTWHILNMQEVIIRKGDWVILYLVLLPIHLNCRLLSLWDQAEDQLWDDQRITKELFDGSMIKIFCLASANICQICPIQ